ncbi:dihydrodipicolinate synthase family protein [Paenibacillus agricola]|uniref:Dihydrodipicolinate synthase family protein n=1 Tax=Paenibacillus agricola TaxID=2716264 RepID=A0ABX0JDK9_9BACL|nr:dihydrodipicolinate synthase family protein [Paenibacillus agricola]NHN31785.1 dihydrodipicolinate synthase family protein [Paenibacillus agricola]
MAKQLLNMDGIVTVLNTPFTDKDTIDIPSLRKHVHYALDAGVAGFLVPAMASEVGKLSDLERKLMVETVVSEVKGEVPVIGGASAQTSEQRRGYAKQLIELGCEGVLVSFNYDNDQQYEQDVREIAELKPGFLMIQDWDFQGFGVPVPLISRLFKEIDEFQSLKIEVVPAGVKYSQVIDATSGQLHVAGGWAVSQLIEGLDRGVNAFMPTGMHEIYVRIYSLYRQGDRAAAKRLFNRLLPVLSFSNQHLDISIHFFKRLLAAQHIYTTKRVREPILPFDAYHEILSQDWVEYVIQLTEEIAN